MDNKDGIQASYSCEDWEHHYKTNDLGWDLGEVAPPFVRLWEEKKISPCKAIIPGCGQNLRSKFLENQSFV